MSAKNADTRFGDIAARTLIRTTRCLLSKQFLTDCKSAIAGSNPAGASLRQTLQEKAVNHRKTRPLSECAQRPFFVLEVAVMRDETVILVTGHLMVT